MALGATPGFVLEGPYGAKDVTGLQHAQHVQSLELAHQALFFFWGDDFEPHPAAILALLSFLILWCQGSP